MKLKNILSIAFSIIALVACSSESDVLNEISNTNANIADSNNAYITFNVGAEKAVTKAGEISGSELLDDTVADNITHCTLFVFNDNNTVYRVYDINPNENFKIEVKVEKGQSKKFHIIAVANTSANMTSCTNVGQVIDITQNNAADFPKVSTPTTIEIAGGDDKNITLTLQQIAAQIWLEDFDVTFVGGGKDLDWSISELSLVNLVTSSKTEVNGGTANYSNKDLTNWEGKFVTFSNTNENKAIAVSFLLTYGDRTKECYFKINPPTADGSFNNNSKHEYIQSGFIYKVKVKAILTSDSIDCDLVCFTEDWVYNELEEIEIPVDLTEKNYN